MRRSGRPHLADDDMEQVLLPAALVDAHEARLRLPILDPLTPAAGQDLRNRKAVLCLDVWPTELEADEVAQVPGSPELPKQGRGIDPRG